MSEECLTLKVKTYVDSEIKSINTRLDGMDRATVIKTQEIDRRLEEHNKLRKEVLTDRVAFVRADTFDIWKAAVNEKLTTLMNQYDKKMTVANWAAVIGVFITVANLILIIMKWN